MSILEDKIYLLAVTGCPPTWKSGDYCMNMDDEMYCGSAVDTCRACWLKWLSEESEGV